MACPPCDPSRLADYPPLRPLLDARIPPLAADQLSRRRSQHRPKQAAYPRRSRYRIHPDQETDGDRRPPPLQLHLHVHETQLPQTHPHRHRTTCSVQFSGILVINNYGPTLYAGLGFDTNTQFLYQGGWITLAFGCGVLSLLFVDRFPRNKFIAFGIAGCMACLIVECALDATYASTSALAKPNETALKAAVAMIYVYVVFYEICLDGVQFAYIGEIFPTHLRAKGIALGVAGICLMNVIWLQGEYLLLNLSPFYILPMPM